MAQREPSSIHTQQPNVGVHSNIQSLCTVHSAKFDARHRCCDNPEHPTLSTHVCTRSTPSCVLTSSTDRHTNSTYVCGHAVSCCSFCLGIHTCTRYTWQTTAFSPARFIMCEAGRSDGNPVTLLCTTYAQKFKSSPSFDPLAEPSLPHFSFGRLRRGAP